MKVNEQGGLIRFRSCRRPNSCILAARRSAVADLISGICKSDRFVVIMYTEPSTFVSVGLLLFLIHDSAGILPCCLIPCHPFPLGRAVHLGAKGDGRR